MNIRMVSIVSCMAVSMSGAAFAADPIATSASTALADAVRSGKGFRAAGMKLEMARSAAVKSELQSRGVDIDEINRPWQIFLKALVDKFNVSDAKYIQFVAAPQPADWSDANYSAFRTSFYGDTIPKWGAVFDPQGASSFADVYGTFINSIKLTLGNPADQRSADVAREKWSACDNALQNRYKMVAKHWRDFTEAQQGLPPAQRMNFQTWYARFEAPEIGAYTQQCNGLGVHYIEWFNRASGGQANFASAIQRYSAARQVSALVPGTTDQFESVWPYAFVQSLGDWVAASEAAPNLAFDQTFTKTSGTYASTTTTWGASASYGWFFHARASGSRTTVDTHSDEFGLAIQLKGLQAFDVRPGGWFSQPLVQFWKDGPFQPGSPIERMYQAGTLYGPNGLFSLRSARFIVAYKPTIKIKMSAANYHEVKSSFSGGGGFGIGPFSFGASGGSSSTNISWDDTNNTLTAQDSSTVPQVIAVLTDVLPDFK